MACVYVAENYNGDLKNFLGLIEENILIFCKLPIFINFRYHKLYPLNLGEIFLELFSSKLLFTIQTVFYGTSSDHKVFIC